MATTSTISSKGQITVPLKARKRLGVKEGDRVEFNMENGVAVLRPARDKGNPFAQFAGCHPSFKSMEDPRLGTRDFIIGAHACPRLIA